jgi:hypothetical protein
MAFTINSKGTCVPDKNSLSLFRGVQMEINRFLALKNKRLLTVDGKLGSNTLEAINFIQGLYISDSAHPSVFAQNCSVLSEHAASYAENLRKLAATMNAPVVPAPSSIVRRILNPQPKVDPSTGEISYPPSVATAGLFGVPFWAIALVGAGGGYYYFNKTKGGKKQWKALTKGS